MQKITWGLPCADCDVLRGVRRPSLLLSFRAHPASIAHVAVSSLRLPPLILAAFIGFRTWDSDLLRWHRSTGRRRYNSFRARLMFLNCWSGLGHCPVLCAALSVGDSKFCIFLDQDLWVSKTVFQTSGRKYAQAGSQICRSGLCPISVNNSKFRRHAFMYRTSLFVS